MKMKKKILMLAAFAMTVALLTTANVFGDTGTTGKIVFMVDHGATMKLHEKPVRKEPGSGSLVPVHYVPFKDIEPVSKETKDWKNNGKKYDKYTYEVKSNTAYSYRLSEAGKVTYAGWIRGKIDFNDVSDPGSYHDLTETEILNNDDRVEYDTKKTFAYYDDGLLTNANIDGSSSIDMKKGETFSLRAFRTQQVVNGGNYLLEPDFHYSVVSGDSVSVGDDGQVTAKKPGFSVIRVTYDAFRAGDLGEEMKYNATDPVLTGIVAVNVDGKDADFDKGINLKEFDTVYYDEYINDATGKKTYTGKKNVEYGFKPSAGTEVSVLEAPDVDKALTGSWTSDWTSYTPDAKGFYKIKLKPGKNIVKVEKDGAAKYHVIRAAGLGVEIRNVGNEGKPLSVGDTAEIHLEGLYLPVPKMAGIYNPGIFTYSGMIAPGVRYEIDGEIHKGTATQYALRNTNKLRFKLESEGELDLTSGKVDEGYMGSRGQYHYNIPEEGLIRNFSAVGIEGLYDVLPDIRLFVEGKKELADDEKNQIKEIMMPAKETYQRFMYNTDAVDAERKDIGVEFASGDEFAKMSYVSYSSGTPFALKGSCKSDDVRTILRYWYEGNEERHVKTSEGGNIDYPNAEFMPPTNKIINAELIVVPKDGKTKPKTYAWRSETGVTDLHFVDVMPFLKDVGIKPVDGGDDLDDGDGRLHAAPATYKDESGEEKSIDFGYGFLTTESDYVTELPESVGKIRLDLSWIRGIGFPSNEYAKAVLSVDETGYSKEYKGPDRGETNPVTTDEIPLNPLGDTTVRLNLSTTAEKAKEFGSTYTIKIKRHGVIKKKDVTLVSETEGADITVKNDKGRIVSPKQGNSGTYRLASGEYTYTASKKGYISSESVKFTVNTDDGNPTQVINIPALEGPKTVTFNTETQDTNIIVKTKKGKTVAAGEDGSYKLLRGSYSYIASAPGHLAISKDFEVGKEENQRVDVPALADSPSYGENDTVTVSIKSDSAIPLYKTGTKMSSDSAVLDLAKQKYVEYNSGRYTALHAMIRAIEAMPESMRIAFTCSKGKLKPQLKLTGVFKDGRWICRINGKEIENPAEYETKAGDDIVYYYSKGYPGMTYCSFDKNEVKVKKGEPVKLKLTGNVIGETGGEGEEPIEGADIKDNNVKVGTTSSDGTVTLKKMNANDPVHIITAEKKDSEGRNILTFSRVVAYVEGGSGGHAIKDKKSVTFRLIGDDILGNDGLHKRYTTWIATENLYYDPEKKITVYDVFKDATESAGLKENGADNNYVKGITQPESLGGAWLNEKSNGPNSGWMYTVNGEHPQVGLKQCTVEDGDAIVWHYINDYTVEESMNTWLEAPDVNPKGIIPYAAKKVMQAIGKLPKLSLINEKNYEEYKERVKEIYAEYEPLSDADKAEVANLKKLRDVEGRIREIEQRIKDETSDPGKQDDDKGMPDSGKEKNVPNTQKKTPESGTDKGRKSDRNTSNTGKSASPLGRSDKIVKVKASKRRIVLKWNRVPEAVSYRVSWRQVGKNSNTGDIDTNGVNTGKANTGSVNTGNANANSVNVAGTSYSISKLSKGSLYTVKCSAMGSDGKELASVSRKCFIAGMKIKLRKTNRNGSLSVGFKTVKKGSGFFKGGKILKGGGLVVRCSKNRNMKKAVTRKLSIPRALNGKANLARRGRRKSQALRVSAGRIFTFEKLIRGLERGKKYYVTAQPYRKYRGQIFYGEEIKSGSVKLKGR